MSAVAQKMRHSVGLNRITDKLTPSIDWKKSFNRSSTQAWGSRDRLSWAVKIWTKRLYFSHGCAPSATGAEAGDSGRGSITGPSAWSSRPALPSVPPTAPRRGRGGLILAGFSLAALDLPGIFGLCFKVRWQYYKLGRALWIGASPWWCSYSVLNN